MYRRISYINPFVRRDNGVVYILSFVYARVELSLFLRNRLAATTRG
jgi:hypothetical protein